MREIERSRERKMCVRWVRQKTGLRRVGTHASAWHESETGLGREQRARGSDLHSSSSAPAAESPSASSPALAPALPELAALAAESRKESHTLRSLRAEADRLCGALSPPPPLLLLLLLPLAREAFFCTE